MKAISTLIATLLVISFFSGCAKDTALPETQEDKITRLLTGAGNKVWRLKEVYITNVKQTLTDYQSKYTKTYTASLANLDPSNPKTGTFTNSDGYAGTWKLTDNAAKVAETINNGTAAVAISYSINAFTETLMDVEFTYNNKLQREVYYAY